MFTVEREEKGGVSALFLPQKCTPLLPLLLTVNDLSGDRKQSICLSLAIGKLIASNLSVYNAQTRPESCINSRFRAYICKVHSLFPAISGASGKVSVRRMAYFVSF